MTDQKTDSATKKPRVDLTLRTSIHQLEQAIHGITHDMKQWPHTEDYDLEAIILSAVVVSLQDKRDKELSNK